MPANLGNLAGATGLEGRRQWQPTPVLLPGKSRGWRSLVGWVHGVARSQTRLSDFTFTFHFHALEKEMAAHSSVLAWRIPGTGKPGGLPSMGSHRVGHVWSDLAAAAAAATGLEEVSFRSNPKERQHQRMPQSSHALAKQCSKVSKPGFKSTWTVNFQMFKLNLEKAEEPEIKLPTFAGSSKKQESSRKISTSALFYMPKSLTRPPDLPPKNLLSRSNS